MLRNCSGPPFAFWSKRWEPTARPRIFGSGETPQSSKNKKTGYPYSHRKYPVVSGREDSNLRSLVPQTSTLTGLCYAPKARFFEGLQMYHFCEMSSINQTSTPPSLIE